MTYFSRIFAGMVVAVLIATVGACRKMEMDDDQWRQIIQNNYPIDSVDKQHTWDLLNARALRIGVRLSDTTITRVQVLDGNPYQTAGVEILADRFYTKGATVSPSFTVPATKTQFWVAAVNSQGKYYVMPVGDDNDVVIAGANVTSSGTLNKPVPQTFTYLFEEDFPLPGDFDFNDVVMRISQQPLSKNVLRISVTLAAVGATKQIGAAIRLPQLRYTDIESVDIEEGSRFDEGITTERYFIDDDRILDEARDKSAIINLFDDAHWCMKQEEEYGKVKRLFYNTSSYEVKDESAIVPTVTRTYDLHLREGIDASFQQLADMDPFIMEIQSNGILVVEVHTFNYKYTEAIWRYTNGPGDEDDMVPWALLVPDGAFHYPVEGIFIGRYRNGESTGAYSRWGHSFGEWGRNRTRAQDWWLYENATQSQVY